MTSPHYQGKIPWHCLTDHVDFDRSTGFKIRLGSQIEARKKAFAHFTRVFASLIVEVAEGQLSVIPKPNASPDAWRDVGVQDNALFPVDFVDSISVPAYINTHDTQFCERQYWEQAYDDYDGQFILAVLTTPANPFRHLAPLIYLAQHPRVAMRNFLSIYTFGQDDTDQGLRSFTFFTVNYYVLLNLVLALDSGASFDRGMARASHFHSRFQFGRPLSVSYGNNDPHTAFWYSSPPAYQSSNLRAEYSLRCFRLLAALYAIMKETTVRDIAVGLDPYKSYGVTASAFDKGTLVNVICRALKNISPAFSDLEPSLAEDSPAVLPPNPPGSNISHQHKGKSRRRQSRFVGLPTELHRYIYSFLPISLQSLVDLAATCKRLREICTPLIYIDPFPSLAITVEERRALERRSSGLAVTLSSKPQLASHIRRLRVRVEGATSSDDIPMLKYPRLQLFLADSITHLVELHLYLPYACSNCTAERREDNSLEVTCHLKTLEVIAAITRRWPNLSCLSLFSLGAGRSHLDGEPTIQSPTPLAAASIPRKLEKLTIIAGQYGSASVSWATQKALMNASSQTLRHLVLDNKQTAMHDLPVFPSLERLDLSTVLPIEDIRPLLRKSFSSVRFLSLDSMYDVPISPGISLDLANIFEDLQHLTVTTWSRLPLTGFILPPSVVTVQVYYFDVLCYPSISVTGSPHLEALCFGGQSRTIFDVFVDPAEGHSSAFQTVRSLELRVPAEADDLARLGEIIAARLPKLEVLILSIISFSDRPRREDYPMDDGLDDVQKEAAVSLFESCPGLNAISFSGVPDVWDPIGHFPGRVWTRDSGDGGARMTGRAALPWKVGEIWPYVHWGSLNTM